jgi:hypothetical protein
MASGVVKSTKVFRLLGVATQGQHQPDGSGMYTAQVLCTMAREGLNVTTVVSANRNYAVLEHESFYLGGGQSRTATVLEIARGILTGRFFVTGCVRGRIRGD